MTQENSIVNNEEKSLWKRKKFLVTAGGIILSILGYVFGEKLTPEYMELIKTIVILVIVFLSGHTFTDIASMFTSAKKSGE